MGLLDAIYAAASAGVGDVKRNLRGLLDDPKGEILRRAQQYVSDQNGLLNLQDNAYPVAGDRTVLNSPDQIAKFQRELADAGANQAMAGTFQGFTGKTYYEPPDVRMGKLKKLYGAFGSKDPTTYAGGMSPQMARGLHEKGLLKATPSETKLLLDMTDELGNIRPQIEAPPGVVNGNRSNDMYLNQLERDPKRQQYMYGR